MRGLFITAVGTGVGKTLVTTILCHQLTQKGRRVRALKPVVSGYSPDDAESDPALILKSLGEDPTPSAVAAVAPWRFALPLAPSWAARREGRPFFFRDVLAVCRESARHDGDFLLIEGAGGVMSPLDDAHTCLDLIADLGLPALLVTGSYLGAISHTLTALCALRTRAARVQAVVVSESAPGVELGETVKSLSSFVETDLAVYGLPRIRQEFQPKWRAPCSLIDLCDLETR
jgi:dethiobiotin synthetase